MNINIIFEDDFVLVVDKPAGLVVNRSESQKEKNTLQDWVEENIKLNIELQDASSEFINRSGIVHRLDKDTSGLIIVAKDAESFEKLQSQFKSRDVEKKYVAVVYGSFGKKMSENKENKPEIGYEIIVDAPIGRNPNRRDKFAVVESGKPAITKFVLNKIINTEDGEISVVDCYPKTGRTHQIRVHLTALGYPVVGDKLYSGRKHKRKFEKIYERQYLHASEIEFLHPTKNEIISLVSPIPEDIKSVID